MADFEVVYHSGEPYYRVPYVGPIGDNRPILMAEINGMRTTILFAMNCRDNCIPEDQIKQILPNYLALLKPSEKKVYGNIIGTAPCDGKILGKIDLELKVGLELINAPFCVVRKAAVSPAGVHDGETFTSVNPSGHLLIGGNQLLEDLCVVMAFGRNDFLLPMKPNLQLSPPWLLDQVRDATIAKKWTEIKVRKTGTWDSGLLKFEKDAMDGGKWSIDIHCSTGAVQTTLDHPTNGKNQHDRKVKDMDELAGILENPSKHSDQLPKMKPICTRASCNNPGKHRCSRCKAVFYCQQECLTEDWSNHKLFCDYVFKAKKVPNKETEDTGKSGTTEEVD